MSRRGLTTLGEDGEHTYFVLSHDDGATLQSALIAYSAAEDRHGAKGPLGTVFDKIEGLEPYGPIDRRGVGLDELPSDASSFVVDVSVWPADDYAEARRRADVIEAVVALSGGELVHPSQVSSRVTVVRVRVTCTGLDDLLSTSVVENVRTPPVPFMDPSDWQDISLEDIRIEQVPGTAVGILDDAPATGHPMLAPPMVASVDEFGPEGYLWPPQGHHGSLVTGRVIYPRMERALRAHEAFEAVGQVHVARVLEPDPQNPLATRFAGGELGQPPHLIVRQAIENLAVNYGVRVFNLSIGYRDPYDGRHVNELTETLDDLARELDIVVVVPTGNIPANAIDGMTPSGRHGGHDYPAHLDTPQHRLSEPGPAALAICVGSLAHSDAPRDRNPPRLGDRAVAPVGGVSPFSRSGPGVGTIQSFSNKPDFVEEGGNWVTTDSGGLLLEDPGVAIISTALAENGRLFRAASGTSFAVPLVARAAADVLDEYPDSSANLVRALLGASASNRGLRAESITDLSVRRRRYGLGRPMTHAARVSDAQRVTMTFDGEMTVDTVVIHAVPVPEDFARTRSSSRRLRVALAYDPPVRRQRREYLASTMQIDLYRSVSLDDLSKIVGKQDIATPEPMLKDRRRVSKLFPGVDHVRSSTLQVREWEPKQLNVDDGETYYLVITNTTRQWARERDDYNNQRYALAVVLEDEGRLDLDLFALVTQRVQPEVRARLRSS